MLILSILLISNLASFTSLGQLKLGSESAKTHTNGPLNGELVVKVEANVTSSSISATSSTNSSSLSYLVLQNVPLEHVRVEITPQENLSSHMINYTDQNGLLNVSLVSSTYYVSFNDWRFNDSQLSVQVEPGQTTIVSAYLNATSYLVTSFDILDPQSSGTIVNWDNLFVQLPNPGTIDQHGATAFLITDNLSSGIALDSTIPAGVTPVSMSSAEITNNSQWMTLRVGSQIPIRSIQSMTMLVFVPIFEATIQ